MDWEHTVNRITQIDFAITVAIASVIVFGLKVWGSRESVPGKATAGLSTPPALQLAR